ETVSRYGRLTIERDDRGLVLTSSDDAVLREVITSRKIQPLLEIAPATKDVRIIDWARGELKQELLKLGWPAEDRAGFTPGTPFDIELHEDGWSLREYQQDAVKHFTD